jgi:hypothetical protein
MTSHRLGIPSGYRLYTSYSFPIPLPLVTFTSTTPLRQGNLSLPLSSLFPFERGAVCVGLQPLVKLSSSTISLRSHFSNTHAFFFPFFLFFAALPFAQPFRGGAQLVQSNFSNLLRRLRLNPYLPVIVCQEISL